MPLSATCHFDGSLYVRLSGAEAAVQAAHARLGGEAVESDGLFWTALRDHTHPFFTDASTLLRVSVPATAELEIGGPQLIEWGGALRWTSSEIPQHVRERIVSMGGHITRFRGPPLEIAATFQQLTPALHSLHLRLKKVFDPHGVFSAGRAGTALCLSGAR